MTGSKNDANISGINADSTSTNSIRCALECISGEKKVDVAVSQLAERYTALHNMRDRSMQFAVWILGLGFVMAWLLISEVALTPLQTYLTFAFLVVIGVASFLFVRGIHIGFKNNMAIAARLEEALMLFEAGTYHRTLPVLNGDFNSKKFKPTEHFFTLYCLLAAVYLFLVLLVIVNPCAKTDGLKAEKTAIEKATTK
ncbi:MAG: hypothetical protein Q7J07_02900 [Pelolinea sp.]|nr:hypothetical protein [Pelolinea sp.]